MDQTCALYQRRLLCWEGFARRRKRGQCTWENSRRDKGNSRKPQGSPAGEASEPASKEGGYGAKFPLSRLSVGRLYHIGRRRSAPYESGLENSSRQANRPVYNASVRFSFAVGARGMRRRSRFSPSQGSGSVAFDGGAREGSLPRRGCLALPGLHDNSLILKRHDAHEGEFSRARHSSIDQFGVAPARLATRAPSALAKRAAATVEPRCA